MREDEKRAKAARDALEKAAAAGIGDETAARGEAPRGAPAALADADVAMEESDDGDEEMGSARRSEQGSSDEEWEDGGSPTKRGLPAVGESPGRFQGPAKASQRDTMR